jgi:hypothetical protein
VSQEVEDLWLRALRALRTAELLGDEDPDASASRSYYAAYYNENGSFDQVAARISGVISVGGSHRGTPAADIICDPQDDRCPQLGRNCTQARVWLQTSDAFQVNQYASSPAKTIWLTGGYKNFTGSCTLALPGEDDTVLPYASQFACGGSALQSYSNANVCSSNAKQESANFRNLDAAYEDHDDEKNNYNTFFDRARHGPLSCIRLSGQSVQRPGAIARRGPTAALAVELKMHGEQPREVRLLPQLKSPDQCRWLDGDPELPSPQCPCPWQPAPSVTAVRRPSADSTVRL